MVSSKHIYFCQGITWRFIALRNWLVTFSNPANNYILVRHHSVGYPIYQWVSCNSSYANHSTLRRPWDDPPSTYKFISWFAKPILYLRLVLNMHCLVVWNVAFIFHNVG